MDNQYYERLSEMNPGDLADGLAMEAEFNAIAQAFGKLPTPHTGGQGFDGPVRVGDAKNNDEAVNLGQLQAAIGEAVLLDIATYGNLAAAEWGTLPSNTYLLFGTGSQFSNTPYNLVASSTYYLQVRHVIGGVDVNIYHDQLSLASSDDASNVDLRRLFARTGSTFTNANAGGWAGFVLKKAALTALEPLTPAADQITYYTSGAAAALTQLTAFMRTLLDDANAAAALSTLDIADLYKRRNIIGAVSQSGGVPTGSIIERGSNANGEYVRFADGTQWCWGTLSITDTPINLPSGVVYQSGITTSQTFPIAFSSVRLFHNVGYSSGGARPWSVPATTTSTNFSVILQSGLSMAAFNGAVFWHAIGRWY